MKNVSRREMYLWIAVAVLATLASVMGFNMAGGWPLFQAVFTPAVPVMPVVAAGIATVSLFWAAFSTWQGWRRSKRQATIEAWAKWSDSTFEDRKLITKYLGVEAITEAQGKALVHKEELSGNNRVLTTDERNDVANAVVRILNGLERLAVGAEQGVYDRSALEELGATTIIRLYKRFEEYVHARRTEGDRTLRQTRAFITLEKLSGVLQHKKYDLERIRALRS